MLKEKSWLTDIKCSIGIVFNIDEDTLRRHVSQRRSRTFFKYDIYSMKKNKSMIFLYNISDLAYFELIITREQFEFAKLHNKCE
jgi:hypothetical protein